MHIFMINNSRYSQHEQCLFLLIFCLKLLCVPVPGQQDALVLLELLHKRRVGFGDSAALLHVFVCTVQVPAVLLHGVCNHSGSGTTHAHFTVHQTLHTSFPVRDIKQTTFR